MNPNDLPVDYGIPEDPFHPPQEEQRRADPPVEQQPVRRRRADRWPQEPAQTAPAPAPAQEGPSFAPPGHAEVPDWLRTAQQLNPSMTARPAAPRVQAAPRRTEWEEPPQPMPRAYVSRPPVEAEPGWRVEADEPQQAPSALPQWVSRVPWLGLAAFAVVMAAVIVWVTGMNLTVQKERVLAEREARQQALYDTYPLHYRELIGQKAEKYNLSPAFVAAIMLNESSFRPDATSPVDARGLMQLMNDTASWIHGKMNLPTAYDFASLYDPEINAEFGCWYLHFLSERFRGDPILVAAAFHAGQGEVQNWLNSSRYSTDHQTIRLENLPEGPTRQYVTRVLAAFAAYKRLYYGG